MKRIRVKAEHPTKGVCWYAKNGCIYRDEKRAHEFTGRDYAFDLAGRRSLKSTAGFVYTVVEDEI